MSFKYGKRSRNLILHCGGKKEASNLVEDTQTKERTILYVLPIFHNICLVCCSYLFPGAIGRGMHMQWESTLLPLCNKHIYINMSNFINICPVNGLVPQKPGWKNEKKEEKEGEVKRSQAGKTHRKNPIAWDRKNSEERCKNKETQFHTPLPHLQIKMVKKVTNCLIGGINILISEKNFGNEHWELCIANQKQKRHYYYYYFFCFSKSDWLWGLCSLGGASDCGRTSFSDLKS